jgi:S1-C subfamily serine protease
MAVREMDQAFSLQSRLADHVRGVVVAAVDPVSPAFEADIERDQVVLEVNRQPTHTLEDYLRLTDGVRSGDVLAIYLYAPQRRQHQLRTVRIEER